MAARIFAWAWANIKTTLAILSFLLASVLIPGGRVLWVWFIDSTDSSAMTQVLIRENELRKLKDIEQDTNVAVIISTMKDIKESQYRAEDRVYKELQQARQQRLSHP